MAKRYTDTEVWAKPWFMELTPAEKLAWFYIKDQCDNVGVWTPNYRLAEFQIGTQLDWEKFASKCNGNVHITESGKWWLVDYCKFQHPDFVANPDGGKSKALLSYVRDLKNHGLYEHFLDESKGIQWASDGHYSAPKAKQSKARQGKAKSSGKIKHPTLDVPMTQGWYDRLAGEWGEQTVDRYIGKVMAWDSATGAGTKDFAARAATFIDKDVESGRLRKEPQEKHCPSCGQAYLGYMCVSCGWEQPA